MIQFERVTTEDVILASFMDDPKSIGLVLSAADDDHLSFTYTIRHNDISAKYAKEILKNYLAKVL